MVDVIVICDCTYIGINTNSWNKEDIGEGGDDHNDEDSKGGEDSNVHGKNTSGDGVSATGDKPWRDANPAQNSIVMFDTMLRDQL